MKKLKILFASLLLNCGLHAQTWTLVTNPSTRYLSNNMALLSDGSIMIKTINGGFNGYSGKSWSRLIPDSTGSYINGTWSLTDSMHYDKVYFSSVTRSDGKVMTGYGMYFTDSSVCELYDPATNTWSFADTTISNGIYPATVLGAPSGLMSLPNNSVTMGGHQVKIFTPVLTGTFPYWVPQLYFYKDTTLITPPTIPSVTTTYDPFWAFSSSLLALPDGSVIFCAAGTKHPYIYK